MPLVNPDIIPTNLLIFIPDTFFLFLTPTVTFSQGLERNPRPIPGQSPAMNGHPTGRAPGPRASTWPRTPHIGDASV